MSKELLNELLTATVNKKASDLHLSSGAKPIIRLDGDITDVDEKYQKLSSEDILKMLESIMNEKQKESFKESFDIDFAYEIKDVGRFRVNGLKINRGFSAVFRVIPSKVLTMEDLNMGSIFRTIASYPRGLVLVTGQTGSGKSTTLSAMIDYINKNSKQHILTIEDPIEFVHENKQCLVSQREVHRDTESFSSALKSALREDPDIILVGEMRDLETIRLALTAAETGHLVFGTLHTTSAIKTVDRIIDVFPPQEKEMVRAMFSESLQAVISQSLLKRKGGGRVAVHEIMIGTPSIRNNIRENKLAQMYSTIQTGSNVGMTTLDQSLKELVQQGLISKEDAKSIAKSPETFL